MPIRSEKERDILIMVDMKAKPFYLSEEDCKWVEETIAGMTTEEKIGQLFIYTIAASTFLSSFA